MPRFVTGCLALFLVLLTTGCATSEPRTVPILVTPMVPAHLTAPLQAPVGRVIVQRDLLELLADYEALRRRANADRAAVVEILANDAGDEK